MIVGVHFQVVSLGCRNSGSQIGGAQFAKSSGLPKAVRPFRDDFIDVHVKRSACSRAEQVEREEHPPVGGVFSRRCKQLVNGETDALDDSGGQGPASLICRGSGPFQPQQCPEESGGCVPTGDREVPTRPFGFGTVGGIVRDFEGA